MAGTGKKIIVWVFLLLAVGLIASVIIYAKKDFLFSKAIQAVLLKPGKPLQFGEYTLVVDKIEGSKLTGIKVTGKTRRLEAASGDYRYLPKDNSVEINLFDGKAEDSVFGAASGKQQLTFKKYHMVLKIK